jgi:uncharacterized protein (TIGR00369 family)
MLNLEKMNGLELMQALVAGDLPPPGIANTIPMQPVEVERGRVVFIATADARHSNPLGGVHGGFAATVLDSVMGCATHTMLSAGEGYGTTDLSIKMCRPIPFGTKMVVEGKVINGGRTLVVSEGYVCDEAGKIYAHATATNMIIRR